ncbi:uncharacterized protein EV420DRAFT_1634560 [Desarmillaria tabescens]|uniref:Uncharacterized protein n=1 Tax=Armillaria tabescens TaxID=1929756 RepID=A0AA39NQW3_ARMTA|nr:uncharacterized protein EV420DRAFT_1634560 [Desarmillaria tabescens]KAK0470136.1 hypothetical protein EV420DRAFT_1634560 [Desarmillaria tabescens]
MCTTTTLLCVKDYARFFGCRVLTMDPGWSNIEFALEPEPRPLSTLPSREELTTWLIRVLLTTMFPPAFANPMQQILRVRYPSNVVAFITLFLRLYESAIHHIGSQSICKRFFPTHL